MWLFKSLLMAFPWTLRHSVITWYILFNRNQVVYESTSHPPSQIWDSNLRLAKDYKGALSPTIQQRGYRVSHCFLPQPGFHKVHVDGATSPNGTISNISVIIHDSSGHIIAVLSKPLLIHYPPDTVEAITLENDIILAHEMNIPCHYWVKLPLYCAIYYCKENRWTSWPHLLRNPKLSPLFQ